MKIRSITYFLNPGIPIDKEALADVGRFIAAARNTFEAAGFEVQTCRLATMPFPELIKPFDRNRVVELAQHLEKAASDLGFDYIAIGPALPDVPESYEVIPAVLEATEIIFASGVMTIPGSGVSMAAVRACAEVITRVAPQDPNGFGNLYFAALANVPPGSPFFPAAYHQGMQPTFALAVEAADLAVDAFGNAKTLEQAQEKLTSAIQSHGVALSKAAGKLEREFGIPFKGIDFSLAPFPEASQSLGTAIEHLGVPAVGLHGSLGASALITSAIDNADFPRVGFSGLMLPLLEDASLAQRGEEGVLSVKDLLMYSAVCGTGLDTVPLPGDTTAEELVPLLLDIAALAVRLDKPLTARLMPVPGKKAGDRTTFDFPFFANSRVMALESKPLTGALAGEGFLGVKPRFWLHRFVD